MLFKRFLKSFWDAVYYTVHHDGIEHAGYLAFLGLLALFPFLVFFTAIAGFLGESQVVQELADVVMSGMHQDLIQALTPRVKEITEGPPQGLLTLAIIGAIWTASSAVEGLRTILNRAYHVATPPAYIWRRLLSIGQFLVLTVIIFAAMFGLIFLPAMWGYFVQQFEIKDIEELVVPYLSYIRYFVAGLVLFLGVATSYYILPNIKQSLRSVAFGAFLVVVGWLGVTYGFTAYLTNFKQVNIIYGSLGGVIVALLFFYILAVIYIFGAEFNYFYEKATGHKIEQKEEVLDAPKADI